MLFLMDHAFYLAAHNSVHLYLNGVAPISVCACVCLTMKCVHGRGLAETFFVMFIANNEVEPLLRS